MREWIARAGREDPGERRQVGNALREHVDAVGAEVLEPLHVGVRVQHAAREPGVERVEPGADVASEELVLHARQAVGVARKVVEHLGVEEQRAAAQLVLDEELRQRLDLAELLHRLAEVQPQALRAPARHQPEVAQFAQIVTEGNLVGTEPRKRLAQFRPFAAVDRAGPVRRFDPRGKTQNVRAARRPCRRCPQLRRRAEILRFGGERQVEQRSRAAGEADIGQRIAQARQQVGRDRVAIGRTAIPC